MLFLQNKVFSRENNGGVYTRKIYKKIIVQLNTEEGAVPMR